MEHDLLWPGQGRVGDLMSNASILEAMVRVESAWLAALVTTGIAPAEAADELDGLVTADDVPAVAEASEQGGNPVIPLLGLLRQRLTPRNPTAAVWLHRGLTSQDVLDSALMVGLQGVLSRLRAELTAQATALAALADEHRGTVMAGRTLTQHAVPMTFGLKAAGWLRGILDGLAEVEEATLPAQIGGAAGTLAAPLELARLSGITEPEAVVRELVDRTARRLGLVARPPWHTSRSPVSRLGDVFVGCTDAFGRIAADLLTLARPEIGELGEPRAGGRGASSTMPQKANPVLSVLVRRAALAAPFASAQLHLSAADARDERPDGAWHVEWATLRTLARRTVLAASQTTELVVGLQVDVERMHSTAAGAAVGLLAERRSLREFLGGPPVPAGPADYADYVGMNDFLIDAARSAVRDTTHPEPDEDLR